MFPKSELSSNASSLPMSLLGLVAKLLVAGLGLTKALTPP